MMCSCDINDKWTKYILTRNGGGCTGYVNIISPDFWLEKIDK